MEHFNEFYLEIKSKQAIINGTVNHVSSFEYKKILLNWKSSFESKEKNNKNMNKCYFGIYDVDDNDNDDSSMFVYISSAMKPQIKA